MKTIVITGATRGIGFGLAREFLKRGHQVAISGRTQQAADLAAESLKKSTGSSAVFGQECDVREIEQVEAFWYAAEARFNRIDIWINNAGIGHTTTPSWKLPADLAQTVMDTNFLGTFYGCKIAVSKMLAQGHGAVYNMEGYGADGNARMGLSIYGASKSAIRFLSVSLAKELEGRPVILGTLQPGMVATDMVSEQYSGRPEEWQRVKKVFNIFVETVEAVSPPLARKILGNVKNGAQLRAFPKYRVYLRFLTAPLTRRNVFD